MHMRSSREVLATLACVIAIAGCKAVHADTNGSEASASGTPHPAAEFKVGVDKAWFDASGHAVVMDANDVYRFDAKGAIVAHASRGTAAYSSRDGADLRLLGKREVVVLDESLAQKSHCAIADGWDPFYNSNTPYWVVRHGNEFALTDTRSCSKRALPGFQAALQGDRDPKAILVSPDGQHLAIGRGSCERADVYDVATMRKLRTDRAKHDASAVRGCDPVSLADDGHVHWVGRSACRAGDSMTFATPDVAVVTEGGAFTMVRGVKKNPDCEGLGFDATTNPELQVTTLVKFGPSTLDGVETRRMSIAAARPDAMLLMSQKRAWLVRWPSAPSGAPDYAARPTTIALGPSIP
jgi:hypothetical protein